LQNRKNPSVTDTNFLFLVIAVLLLTLGSWVQSKDTYIGLIITEYLIILFPVVYYLNRRGYNLKEFLRLNRLTLKQIKYIVLIVIFSYPIAVFLNYIGILFLSRFGRIMPNPIPIPSNIKEYLLSFIVIALTPGICEEVMFRGMIMRTYEVYGRKKAIILSAVLFGLFHFNLQNLLGPIFLGLMFGVLVSKTKSLLSSIIGHIVNNTVALTIGFLSNDIQKASTDIMPDTSVIAYGSFVLGIIALLFWLIVRKLLISFPVDTNEAYMLDEEDGAISSIKTGMRIIDIIPIAIIIIIFLVWSYIIYFA
jgi:hypothetical protein